MNSAFSLIYLIMKNNFKAMLILLIIMSSSVIEVSNTINSNKLLMIYQNKNNVNKKKFRKIKNLVKIKNKKISKLKRIKLGGCFGDCVRKVAEFIANIPSIMFSIMKYFWKKLLKYSNNIENYLNYIGAWVSMPATMLIETIGKLFSSISKKLKDFIRWIFSNTEQKITENYELTVKLSNKTVCKNIPIEVNLSSNKKENEVIDIKLSKTVKQDEDINKAIDIEDNINAFHMTRGIIYSAIIRLIPQTLPGNQNKEKKKEEETNKKTVQKDVEYFDKDGNKVNVDSIEGFNIKANIDSTSGTTTWNNADSSNFSVNPINNAIPQLSEADGNPNIIEFGILNEDDFSFDRKRKRRRSTKKPIIDVEICKIKNTGLVLDKIASNAADVCAANFFPIFSSITKSIVKSFREIANGKFKAKVRNIIEKLGGTKFESEDSKTEKNPNHNKSGIKNNINFEEEKDYLFDESSKSNKEEKKEVAKESWNVAKTFFDKFKDYFTIGLKKVGSFFKAIKNCFVSFGDEIVKNLGEYSMFLIRNTSLMPVNAFIQSLPGFAQVNSIFSIVRLVFYIWRLLSFPFSIEMKQKELEDLKKDNINKKNNEEIKKKQQDIEFDFYSYGRSLGTAILAGISAVTNAVGVGGILQGVASAAFIGALLTGLVRKGAKFIKSTYSKIRGYFSKGEEQLDKLNKNIVHTQPDERAKVKLGYEWLNLKYSIYENMSPKETEEIWDLRNKVFDVEITEDEVIKKDIIEDSKVKTKQLSFQDVIQSLASLTLPPRKPYLTKKWKD